MAQIEKHDFFVVTRGVKLSEIPIIGHDFIVRTDGEKEYDRSHEGNVYQALEVCGDMIAAKCIHAIMYGVFNPVGITYSLNSTELELWPVSLEYIKALGYEEEE